MFGYLAGGGGSGATTGTSPSTLLGQKKQRMNECVLARETTVIEDDVDGEDKTVEREDEVEVDDGICRSSVFRYLQPPPSCPSCLLAVSGNLSLWLLQLCSSTPD